ncbi:MAG TPA: FAD-binding oxidoreductase [Aeromicrobium sp.]|nr:FAD-binding oxidoreductase [Aeromicrobium sp.]
MRSLWLDQAPPADRPELVGDHRCDVAIVGAGYTGLWAAYYLALASDAEIVVIDAEHVGFGASGRNGGWCSALFPASLQSLSGLPGSSRSAALAQAGAMRATIDEIGRVVQAEGIDCGFAKGGTVIAARSPAQWARAQAAYEDAIGWGRSDLQLLGRDEAVARLNATGTMGATYTPDCAAIHPARLVHGLAATCERLGVEIFHGTRATRIQPGAVATERGTLQADIVLRATEGYTSGLPGQRRTVAPVYSLVMATAPLPAEAWNEIGLVHRETFADHRHVVAYGQRTADDRLVFGGRGAPYHLGSRIRPDFDQEPRVFAMLERTLVEMFPVLRGVETTHTWGGVLGVPRDWCASVGFDRKSGLGWAGGYVGDGVSTTNLAGRTLRDLVLGAETDLTALPWVGHRSPQWEPEPARWLGINAGLRAMRLADAEERITGRPSRIARVVTPLVS